MGTRGSDEEICRRLAANVLAVMDRKGLRKTDVADACGIARAVVSNILSLKHRPTICLVAKLADGLGVSVDRLLRPTLIARAPRSRRPARAS